MAQEIRTERLILRAYRAEDGPRVVQILGDFEVSKWLARVPHPFTEADLRLLNDDGTSLWPAQAAITMGGVLVGGASARPEHFGYWIAPDHHGRGIATEAGRALVAGIFARTGADQIQSGCFEGNHGSTRVLEKLGFEERARAPHFCAARGHDMPNIDMVLTHSAYDAAARHAAATDLCADVSGGGA